MNEEKWDGERIGWSYDSPWGSRMRARNQGRRALRSVYFADGRPASADVNLRWIIINREMYKIMNTIIFFSDCISLLPLSVERAISPSSK